MTKVLISISLALLLTGCCRNISCGPRIEALEISLVDANTREDLFLNEVLESESIEVKNAFNVDIDFEFHYTSDGSRSGILITEQGAIPTAYQILVDSTNSTNNLQLEINIKLVTSDQSSRCCPFYKVDIDEVDSYQFEVNKDYSGQYDILID